MTLGEQDRQRISEIFSFENYQVQNSLTKLQKMGGILGLINYLKSCHRRGLSSNNLVDHEQRSSKFGRNSPPYSENIFKKSLLQERDFIVNFLFYLITLRICVKLLLFRDQLRGLKPLGEQTFVLRINAQLISYLLLAFIILLKAKVSVEYYKMDQDQRKYKNEKIFVKRDGERQQIYEENLMVGDILIVQSNSIVRIDGIILRNKNLIVSEAHTVLRDDIKTKSQIWEVSSDQRINKDCFILAGSFIIGGYGQILVCTVGPNCSFRLDKENKGYYSQYTTNIAQLKKSMDKVQSIAKILTSLLATYISAVYLTTKILERKKQISWIDLLYILKVYCGFIGLVLFVQRLKVIKSLQFFIEVNRSDKEYRIKNKASLQVLSKLSILFIDSNALAMREVNGRDCTKIELDHILEISEINKFCQIKIISEQDRSQIYQLFGKDINQNCVFTPRQQLPYNEHLKSLISATFLSQTSLSTFIYDYLPIYRALKYQIGYLYQSNSISNLQIPADILQINFKRLVLHSLGDMPKLKQVQIRNETPILSNDFWIKIQNKLFMQDIVYKLFYKSQVYSELYNIYLTLYINNILVLLVFSYFSTFNSLVNLSWYLLVIIAQRYIFFTIYKRVTQQIVTLNFMRNEKQMSLFQYLKVNIILFFYYFYVINRMKLISSLFLFFVVNGIVRLQAILYKKRPYRQKLFIIKIGKCFAIYILVHLLVTIIQHAEADLFREELNNLKYILGLFLIYIFDALFL